MQKLRQEGIYTLIETNNGDFYIDNMITTSEYIGSNEVDDLMELPNDDFVATCKAYF